MTSEACAKRPRHVPMRMCVVCRQSSIKKTLLRVVRRPEKEGGGIAVDPTAKANGRGAYVCAAVECIDKAIKQKRFARSLGVSDFPDTLAEDLKALVPAEPAATNSSSGASAMC
jgi:predicted RNA-binding protein YlxR (DUF448 family)